MERSPCVYILASRQHGVLYIGVTTNLIKRAWEHRTDQVRGFTQRYQVHQLVWFETHDGMESSITREKRIKKWRRHWKIELIEALNPNWHDLYPTLL